MKGRGLGLSGGGLGLGCLWGGRNWRIHDSHEPIYVFGSHISINTPRAPHKFFLLFLAKINEEITVFPLGFVGPLSEHLCSSNLPLWMLVNVVHRGRSSILGNIPSPTLHVFPGSAPHEGGRTQATLNDPETPFLPFFTRPHPHGPYLHLPRLPPLQCPCCPPTVGP